MSGDNRHIGSEWRIAGLLQWPYRFLGPLPGLKEMNIVCWGLFVGWLVTRFFFPLWLQFRHMPGSIHILPDDFIYFYGIGHIAYRYPLARLYDFSLQLKVFNEIFHSQDSTYGPSPYPPFVALFFSMFARVPFILAFFLWAVVSLTLYLVGIGVVLREVFPRERLKVSLSFCFALAFSPFLRNTLLNGQIATVAVCSVGLAISEERHSRPFVSGLALSILAYKPTLLLLLIPMLLLTRRFRTFCGFITGVSILGLTATSFAGVQIWTAYAQFLGAFGRIAGLNGQSSLLLWQYIDLRAFILSACGAGGMPERIVFITVLSMIAAWIAVLLWKSVAIGRTGQYLAWAVTLTWTLLLNVYVPVYDSILLSLAALLTLGALRDLKWSAAAGWVIALLAFICVASWETDAIVVNHGGQILSLLLAVFGVIQIYLLQRAICHDMAHAAPSCVTE